jgi:PAS domain S-box-containing protein
MPETAVSADLRDEREIGASSSPPHGEEALALLVEAVQDYAIFLLSPDGRILSWNSGAKRLKGYSRDEAIGRHFSTFYTPEDRERGRPQRNLRAALADGRTEDEGWRVRKDGTRFWADVVITALYDRRGKLYGFAKVTRDLTERRRAAEAKMQLAIEQRLRAAAEEAIRERDWFLNIASHELRTPVASLQVATEALMRAHRGGRLDERRLDASLRRIESSVSRMAVLVSELLDVSRLENGQLPLQLEEVQLERIVREVTDGLDGEAARVHVQVEPELRLRADPARLDQVVANLVDNALKYSSGQVRVAAERQDGGIAVTVSDGGIGLEPARLRALFEPFSRGKEVAHIPGMGLGLFIARQIVERHGGRIRADSPGPQRGSTFSVWLPDSPASNGVD